MLFFFLSAASSAIEEIHPKQVPFNSQLPQDMNCSQTLKDHAQLIDRDMCGMNLPGADLNQSELQGSDLRGTNLSRSHLNQSRLFDADLSGSNLCGVFMADADLHGAISPISGPLAS